MAVSAEYRAMVLQSLGKVTDVAAKAMFGGYGLYAEGLIIGCLDNDRIYFKVDDMNRPRFVEKGMGPLVPYEGSQPMNGYYELPPGLLDSPELADWVRSSRDASTRAAAKKKKKK